MTVNLALWLLVLLAGLVLEGVGLLRENDKWEPLTYYIKKYVPKVFIAAAITWLTWHFGVAS